MDLFPQQPCFSTPFTDKDTQILPNYGTNKKLSLKGQRAQVTMIYEGKVFVFSDLPSKKAEEILHLVEKDGPSPQIYTQLNHQVGLAPTTPRYNPNHQRDRSVIIPNFLENINQNINFDVSMNHMTFELPIARRNSLNRFLEKRLDRCGGRGSYHNSSDHLAVASKPRVDSKWWLGLAAQPPQ